MAARETDRAGHEGNDHAATATDGLPDLSGARARSSSGRAARLLGWLLLAGLAVVLLAGCGIKDPDYTSTTPGSTTSATATIAPDEDDGPPSPPPSKLASDAAQASPVAALSRYAQLYVNWTWQTVAANERRLAAISIGQARGEALAAAAQPDQTLARYAVQNQGQVVAIAPGEGVEQGKWAVVTDEQTSGDGPYEGLPATSHVTWATVRRMRSGWVVSGWYPGS